MSVIENATPSIEFFYKENKKENDIVNYVASQNFRDQDGKPIEWQLKPVSASDDALIRESCTTVKTDKRTGVINERFDDQRYVIGLTVKGIVFPPLFDKKLQHSYQVDSAEALLKRMLTAGELQSLSLKVIEVSGLDDIEGTKEDNEFKAELAKNS